MKITNIRATPVNIPLEAPFWWTGGLYPGASKAIVEVETDEGLVGLGEAPSTDVCAMIAAMGEALAGKDPLDIAACERVCVPPWQIVQNTDDARVVKAFGAIEIALWDLRGKAWGQPLFDAHRRQGAREGRLLRIFQLPRGPGDDARSGGRLLPRRCAKSTAARFSRASSSAAIRCSRSKPCAAYAKRLGPSAEIRLDSNMQWSLSTARRVLRRLADYDISNYEDPVATFEEMAALRQHSDIPFSTHVPDLRRAVALGAPDTIVTNFAVLGGIGRALRFIGACEAMGVGYLVLFRRDRRLHRGLSPCLGRDALDRRSQPVAVPLADRRRHRRGSVPAGRQCRRACRRDRASASRSIAPRSRSGTGILSSTDRWTTSTIRPSRAGIAGSRCASEERRKRGMIDGSSTTPARERGVRARRQREAQRTHGVIAGIERQIPTYELLGEEGLVRIEAAADTILQEIGIEFRGDEEALRLWRGAGADVEGELVRFPIGLMRSILKTAPVDVRPARPQSGTLAQDRRPERGFRARLWLAVRARPRGRPQIRDARRFREFREARLCDPVAASFRRHGLRAGRHSRQQAPSRHGRRASAPVRQAVHGLGDRRGTGRRFDRDGADRIRTRVRRRALRHHGQHQRQFAPRLRRDHDQGVARLRRAPTSAPSWCRSFSAARWVR